MQHYAAPLATALTMYHLLLTKEVAACTHPAKYNLQVDDDDDLEQCRGHGADGSGDGGRGDGGRRETCDSDGRRDQKGRFSTRRAEKLLERDLYEPRFKGVDPEEAVEAYVGAYVGEKEVEEARSRTMGGEHKKKFILTNSGESVSHTVCCVECPSYGHAVLKKAVRTSKSSKRAEPKVAGSQSKKPQDLQSASTGAGAAPLHGGYPSRPLLHDKLHTSPLGPPPVPTRGQHCRGLQLERGLGEESEEEESDDGGATQIMSRP